MKEKLRFSDGFLIGVRGSASNPDFMQGHNRNEAKNDENAPSTYPVS
jgi:hypothetical protein